MFIVAQWRAYKGFFSQLVQLALPVAIQTMLVSLLGMIDIFMVGTIGNEAVAAVGLGGKIHFVTVVIMASMATGSSVLIAQYWGTKNVQRAKSVVALALMTGIVLLTVLTALLLVFANDIFRFSNDDPVVARLGVDYILWSAPLLLLTHAIIIYEGALRSLNQTVLPLIMAAIAIGINVLLNYALIDGHFGLPAMGVSGAALATDIARTVQVILILGYLKFSKHPLHLQLADYVKSFDPLLIRKYWRLTWPLIVNFSLWAIGSFGYHWIAGRMGTTPLAVISLISPIEGLYHSIFMGMSAACSIMIGQSLGRSDFDTATKLAKFFVVVNPILSFMLGVVLILARGGIFAGFGHLDEATLALADHVFIIMGLLFWVKVMNMTLINGILRAGGDNRFCLFNDMLSMWVLGLPITAIAALVFGARYEIVYALIMVEEVNKAIFSFWRYRQGHWKRNLTLENEGSVAEVPAIA
ncbi:MATE family efflux transporter [Gynuella sunshinyii]|uniref:Na+-driven multidrug efflux pump n=1 Tax=Gynuella sunshinyii YC6258 TaxID=1445510 RepID=A0A0C5VPZ3_9GAMM|nr:MATE family efflux transporter [Gynuella sunshinyii]AJQ96291.1 Na+-driven multidrug efflux pump [Gynuella sunshinyii YC6258]